MLLLWKHCLLTAQTGKIIRLRSTISCIPITALSNITYCPSMHLFQISMSTYPTMEIFLKLVPTPMEATSAHVSMVMHFTLIIDHAMVCQAQ